MLTPKEAAQKVVTILTQWHSYEKDAIGELANFIYEPFEQCDPNLDAESKVAFKKAVFAILIDEFKILESSFYLEKARQAFNAKPESTGNILHFHSQQYLNSHQASNEALSESTKQDEYSHEDFLKYLYFRLLHALAAHGNEELLELFLSLIPKEKLSTLINEDHPGYGSPLFFSIYSANAKAAEILIRYGADKTLVCETELDEDKGKMNALQAAAASCWVDFLEVLYVKPENCKVQVNIFEKLEDRAFLFNIVSNRPSSLQGILATPDLFLSSASLIIKQVARFFIEKKWPGYEEYAKVLYQNPAAPTIAIPFPMQPLAFAALLVTNQLGYINGLWCPLAQPVRVHYSSQGGTLGTWAIEPIIVGPDPIEIQRFLSLDPPFAYINNVGNLTFFSGSRSLSMNMPLPPMAPLHHSYSQ